jgi:hypothetical protein
LLKTKNLQKEILQSLNPENHGSDKSVKPSFDLSYLPKCWLLPKGQTGSFGKKTGSLVLPACSVKALCGKKHPG